MSWCAAPLKAALRCGTCGSPTTCIDQRVRTSTHALLVSKHHAPLTQRDACWHNTESVRLGIDTGLRQPTYCTDSMATADGVHCASICAVKAMTTAGTAGSSSSSKSSAFGRSDHEKTAFQVHMCTQPIMFALPHTPPFWLQVLSLDDRGVVNVWVAVELNMSEWYVL